jgi:hypothetical protein
MIKIENQEVFGWEAAIRGMRNPMNSWDKSDSEFYIDWYAGEKIEIVCKNDLELMKSLSKAGTDHSKFLRMINVTVDITAPLYWWKEFDTYKVGTVANSCSTMHKIHDKEFTLDDFSHEHLTDGNSHIHGVPDGIEVLAYLIHHLNYCRELFNKVSDEKLKKKLWWQMIQLLPSSYNQKRTVQLNYQVLKSMYFARKNHKLDEWRDFCKWCETLLHFKEICINE